MKITVSKRDKRILLLFGVALVFFFGIFYGIRPLYAKNIAIQKDIREEQTKESKMKQKIRKLPDVEKALTEIKEKLSEEQDLFYPMMSSTDIDRRLTGMALDYGLVPKDLTIEMPEEETYTSLEAYLSGNKEGKEKAEGEAIESKGYYGLHTAQVSMSLSGNKDSLKKFLDANINNGYKQRVVRYLWSENELESGSDENLDIIMEWYMCEDLLEKSQEKSEE